LTTGCRTALPRHRTLRATLDWSFELLTEAEANFCVVLRSSLARSRWLLPAP